MAHNGSELCADAVRVDGKHFHARFSPRWRAKCEIEEKSRLEVLGIVIQMSKR